MKFLSNIKRKHIIIASSIVVFVSVFWLVISEQGLIKYVETQNRIDSLRTYLKELKIENKRLEGENDSLRRKVPAKIDEIARKKFDMKRENEKVIKVEEK